MRSHKWLRPFWILTLKLRIYAELQPTIKICILPGRWIRTELKNDCTLYFVYCICVCPHQCSNTVPCTKFQLEPSKFNLCICNIIYGKRCFLINVQYTKLIPINAKVFYSLTLFNKLKPASFPCIDHEVVITGRGLVLSVKGIYHFQYASGTKASTHVSVCGEERTCTEAILQNI